ncbi:MAG: hypothetical protein H2054_01020 [Sphingomonas sp.]|jgi:ammonia channel protein AmtB|uniref:hypothetical protein n=1 Tax=Sphingomonas sp. TaxID=28214 RepID=UPI0017FAD884|nr:hypothetical protein [Sphingomonas sp.]
MSVPLLSAPLIMALVAGALALAAALVVTRRTRSEAGVYGRRIAGTMLGAGAVILGGFAFALSGFGSGR